MVPAHPGAAFGFCAAGDLVGRMGGGVWFAVARAWPSYPGGGGVGRSVTSCSGTQFPIMAKTNIAGRPRARRGRPAILEIGRAHV